MDNPPAYTPTTTDVARLLRARTKDATGVELGDWSAETRPTDTEVADLIDQATGPVLAELGRLEDPADPERYADLLPAASVVLAGGYGYDVDYWPEPENPANWAHPAQPPREPPEPGDLPVGDEPASGFSGS
jgi:hypothetical protein